MVSNKLNYKYTPLINETEHVTADKTSSAAVAKTLTYIILGAFIFGLMYVYAPDSESMEQSVTQRITTKVYEQKSVTEPRIITTEARISTTYYEEQFTTKINTTKNDIAESFTKLISSTTSQPTTKFITSIKYTNAVTQPSTTETFIANTTQSSNTAENKFTLIHNHTELPTVSPITPEVVRSTKSPLAVNQHTSSPRNFVYTEHCRMPYVDPFASEVRKMFKPWKPAACGHSKPLVYTSYNKQKKQYFLHMNTTNSNNSSQRISCCYREILRTGVGKGADRNYKLLDCSNFHQDFAVPLHIDSMIVSCTLNKTKSKDAFSFIQTRNNGTRRNNEDDPEQRNDDKMKPSIFLIGIDSVSRMNFRRNMPKTFKFLENNNWLELQGYNKMGDNTFPNLMALLTGYNTTTAYSACAPNVVGGLDNCTLIWKAFKNYGYVTAYAEDTSSISTFNYLKTGFKQIPTDYYLRPMLMAIEKELKVIKKAGLPYCVGQKQYGEYVYDYALELAKRYPDGPTFGLFWTNSFSHNAFDVCSSMDYRLLKYFEEFEKENVFKKHIVVLFSDHGMRFGRLRDSSQGFLEERLPMFFISIPEWFQLRYPEYIKALKVNRNRLTSPYDIHMTFKHIIEIFNSNAKLPPASGCATCQSIFHEIPENRTCEDAGIPEHWCTCEPYENLSTKTDKVKKVTHLIIDQMNEYLAAKNVTSLCKTLKLKSIKRAELRMEEHMLAPDISKSMYRISFCTDPHAAEFQATAIYNTITKSVIVDVESISRLNKYEKVASCMQQKELKKFCIC